MSKFSVHMVKHTCKYIKGCPVEIHSSILEYYRAQYYSSARCVIAQQYSSATFVSLRFRSRMEISAVLYQYYYLNFFQFLKYE